ncbi:MAG: hypothetical protein JW900_08255 [Anaerolineae bacterium]|nr:hypothetical protein [Anaerolineae bacterium]
MESYAYGILCLGLGIYLLSFLLSHRGATLTHRSAAWARLASSAALVVTALIWWIGSGRSTSLAGYAAWIFFGMLLSFVGDLIMARVIPLPDHVPAGIVVFGIAHILYILGYVQASLALSLGNPWAWIIGEGGIFILAVIFWWLLVRAPGSPPLLRYGSLGYMLLLALMAGTAVSLAIQDHRFLMLATGAILFMTSDAILGNRLLRKNDWLLVGDVVWMLYVGGQALIVFSSAALF